MSLDIDQGPRRLELRRRLRAPIETVFDAWIRPEQVETWWGPQGYRTKVLRMNAVVGGAFAFHMTAPSGAACTMTGLYTTVERPTALAFDVRDHCVADLPDAVQAPSEPSHVSLRFTAHDGETEIRLIQVGLAADYQMLAAVGWGDSLERMTPLFA